MWNSGINHNYILLDFLFKLYLFQKGCSLPALWLYLGVLWPKNAQISKSRSFLEMAKSTGFEFVDQIEFGRFLVILWRFSLFTNLLIIVVLVVKLGVRAISGKIAIKLPKFAQIQFGQQIQIRLTLPFPKMIDFLKFGQFWVIRFLNITTGLVDYSPLLM